ncbi:MAG: translation initiation factor Sui1 [Gemmatimonadota bacterium]
MADGRRDGGLVYSTEVGRTCPRCRRAIDECRCAQRLAGKRPSGDGIARVGRETKGRKGKGVTVVTGLPLTDPELADLAKRLKRKCGSGGTVRNGVIEIQGDHRDRIVSELEALGHEAKRAGG